MMAANDNTPTFTATPGIDGLRIWDGRGVLVARGLSVLAAMTILRRLRAA